MLYLISSGEPRSRNRRTKTAKFFKEPGSLSDLARAKVTRCAIFIRKRGAKIDQIWHGPELNAKQTADIFADELMINDIFKKTFLRSGDPVDKCLAKLDNVEGMDLAIVSSTHYIARLAEALKSIGVGDIILV